MLLFLSSLMCQSDHSKISAAVFPLLSKWKFFEGKKINIVECVDAVFAEEGHVGKKVITKTVNTQFLKVELTNGEGLIHIPWTAAQKQHKVSVYVQASHGLQQGCSRWVFIVLDHKITCTEKLSPPPDVKDSEFVPQLVVRATASHLIIYILILLNSNSLFTPIAPS